MEMYFSFSVALFVFLCFGPTRGETCECISYIITEDGLSKGNRIASIEYNIEDLKCDGNGVMQCKDYCVEMYEELTNGKICAVMPGDNQKVADWMCDALSRNVCNARIGVFVQSCGSDPVDTGFRFTETLCCKSKRSTNC